MSSGRRDLDLSDLSTDELLCLARKAKRAWDRVHLAAAHLDGAVESWGEHGDEVVPRQGLQDKREELKRAVKMLPMRDGMRRELAAQVRVEHLWICPKRRRVV